MKIFVVSLLFLMTTLCVSAQKKSQPKLEHIDNEKMQKQIDSSMRELDSMNARINNGYKQTMHTMDSVNNHLEEERNRRSLESFMAMQKKQQAKQKKAAWVRIGLGVFFLGVLVFGLMRRRKKANT